MDDLRAAARTAIEQCLAIEADETCVIVTDPERTRIGEHLESAACEVTDGTILLRMAATTEHGAEPPEPVAAAMAHADAFLAPTTKSLSHTRARSDATDAGARGATLPGITESVFITGLAADYDRIQADTEEIYDALVDATEVHVSTPAGTDITFQVGERSWHRDTGIVQEPGAFSNLPAGEVFISPVSADGRYVVDGTIRPHGRLAPDQQVEITVEDGYATHIDDPDVADSFAEAAESVGRDAYNVAELGIGTNTGVSELVGSVLLDEKAAGTVHIALGDDASIGGTTDAPIHADGVLRNPTVTVDGTQLSLPTA